MEITEKYLMDSYLHIKFIVRPTNIAYVYFSPAGKWRQAICLKILKDRGLIDIIGAIYMTGKKKELRYVKLKVLDPKEIVRNRLDK